jgi:pimeloyl-ACP methyl ester carboxylesterase
MPATRPLAAFALFAATFAAGAQEVDESVIRATLPGRTIAALVTRLPEHDTIRRVVFLMPGNPGIMKVESPAQYAMRSNFVIRSRGYWLDRSTIVASVDAPSDEWCCFTGTFRAGERYAEDLRALRRAIEAVYGAVPFHIVGTSEGSVSAYHAARAFQRTGDRVVYTSSLFNTTRRSHGLASVDLGAVTVPVLWVHHADDPCRYTPYSEARRQSARTGAPLITVRHGNPGSGEACRAGTQHGFIGVERETVEAINTWLLTGKAADVVKP